LMAIALKRGETKQFVVAHSSFRQHRVFACRRVSSASPSVLLRSLCVGVAYRLVVASASPQCRPLQGCSRVGVSAVKLSRRRRVDLALASHRRRVGLASPPSGQRRRRVPSLSCRPLIASSCLFCRLSRRYLASPSDWRRLAIAIVRRRRVGLAPPSHPSCVSKTRCVASRCRACRLCVGYALQSLHVALASPRCRRRVAVVMATRAKPLHRLSRRVSVTSFFACQHRYLASTLSSHREGVASSSPSCQHRIAAAKPPRLRCRRVPLHRRHIDL